MRKGIVEWKIFYTMMTGGWCGHSGMANTLGKPDHKMLELRSLEGVTETRVLQMFMSLLNHYEDLALAAAQDGLTAAWRNCHCARSGAR